MGTVTEDEHGLRPPPGTGAPAGWHAVGQSPNLQAYWDGSSWTSGRRWQGAAWTEVPLSELRAPPAAPSAVTPRTPRAWRRERSRAPWIWLAGGLLAVAGAVVAVVVLTVGETPPPLPAGDGAGAAGASGSGGATAVGGVTAGAAAVACQADVQAVESALQSYEAATGAYPVPAQPWSSGSYVQDFAPLTASAGRGAGLRSAPGTLHYVIEFDGSGHLWVEPPGRYTTSYDPSRDPARSPTACDAAGP